MNSDLGQYVNTIPLNGPGALRSAAQPVLQSVAQPIKFVQQVPQQVAQQVQQIPQQLVQQVQQVPQQVVQQVQQGIHPNAYTTIPVEAPALHSYNSLQRTGGPAYQANQPLQIDLIPSVLTPPATPVATPVTTLERKKKKVEYKEPEPEPESESESEPEPEPEQPKPVKKVVKKTDMTEPETSTTVIVEAPEQVARKEPVIIQPPKQVVIMEPATPVVVTEAPKQVVIMEPATPVIVTEVPKQQPVQKSILKTTTPVLAPVPVPVVVTPTPKQAPIIITEKVSKVQVQEVQEEEEDDGDCCGYSWRCCTITWGVLFGLALAGLIACIVVSAINGNKQNDLLATGFQCDVNYIKSTLTPNAPSEGGPFPRAYTSMTRHLGDSAPNTRQVLMEGSGIQMTSRTPNERAFVVWECGCNVKITYNLNGAGQEVRMGNTMAMHTYYTFYVMLAGRAYTMEMESCSVGYTLISITPEQAGTIVFS